MDKDVNLHTSNNLYDTSMSGSKGKETLNAEDDNSLHIEKEAIDIIPRIPKGVLKKTMFNPNARVT